MDLLLLRLQLLSSIRLTQKDNPSVREFVELAFAQISREIEWSGVGVDEVGKDARTGQILVRIDPAYFRPTEVDLLLGDPSKARRKLGWRHVTSFKDLVCEMVDADMQFVGIEKASEQETSTEAVHAV